VIIIGSDPDDWFEDQAATTRFFGSGGSSLDIQVDALKAYCEGSVGWSVDRIRLKLPNGVEIPTRHTRIFHKEITHGKLFTCTCLWLFPMRNWERGLISIKPLWL
jgi:hypothetical protein